jgi:hypothetical protein
VFTILITAAMALSQAAPATAPETKVKREKPVCKKVMATNSLVRVGKVCRTAKEWEKGSEDARRATEEMQTSSPSQPNG